LSVLVDTSALHAILDIADPQHEAAQRAFRTLVRSERLVTHNYVVIEATALVQRRLGIGAVRALTERLLPTIEQVWVRPGLHERAMAALLAADRRGISIVDWTSFELMRERQMRVAFAFDTDFRAQGFEVVP